MKAALNLNLGEHTQPAFPNEGIRTIEAGGSRSAFTLDKTHCIFSKFTNCQVNTAIKTKPWQGLLASLFLSGAGQFLSGAHRRGIAWFLIIGALPLFLLSFYNLPFVPAKAAISLLGVN